MDHLENNKEGICCNDFVGFKKVHDEWKKEKEEFVKVLIEQGLKINYGQEHEWKVHVWLSLIQSLGWNSLL